MAYTPLSVKLPTSQWINLYDITGIPAGLQIIVQNIGASDVWLATSAQEPDIDTTAYQVIRPNDPHMINDGGDLGEWAFSPNQEARISVRVA